MSQVLAELARLAQQPAGDPATMSVRLVEAQLPPDRAEALRLAAIPHHFTSAILTAMDPGVPPEQAAEICTELVDFGLAVPARRVFRLQDSVRRFYFAEWLKQYGSERFRTLNQRLAELFSAQLAAESNGDVVQCDIVFHAIGASEEAGFAAFEGLFRDYRGQFRVAECSALLTVVHEYDDVLAPAQANRLAYQSGKLAADLRRWEEAEARFTKVAESGATPDWLRFKALLRLGTVYRDQRRWDEAIRTYTGALDVARLTPGTADETRALHWLGTAYRDRGDLGQAEKLLRESLKIATASGDPICTAQGHNALGLVHLRRHAAADALKAFEKGLACLEAHGHQSALLFHNLGSAYLEVPDFARSREYFERSLELKRRQGDVGGQAMTLNNLARAHEAEGRRSDAIGAAEEATRLFEQVHDFYKAAEASKNLGLLYARAAGRRRRSGGLSAPHTQADAADRAFKRAIELFRKAGAADDADALERRLSDSSRHRTIPWWAWAVVAIVLGFVAVVAIFVILLFL